MRASFLRAHGKWIPSAEDEYATIEERLEQATDGHVCLILSMADFQELAAGLSEDLDAEDEDD